MQSSPRFVVCTRDSAPWIGQFLSAYRAIGIEPLYVHDVRSVDDTREILERAGAEVIDFSPSGDYVEAGMIECGATNANSDWVFRIDDDEFPSLTLVRWLGRTGIRSRIPAIICSRRDVFRNGDSNVYTRHPNRYFNAEAAHYLGPHHRMFRPACVRFSTGLHTAGFTVPPPVEFAPQEAFFVHCNCLVRSIGQRLIKLRRYEHISPLSSWKYSDEYVPELFGATTNMATDGLEEFTHLFGSLGTPADGNVALIQPGEFSLIRSEVDRERKSIDERLAAYERRLARQIERYGEPVGHGRNRYRCSLATEIDFSCPGLPETLIAADGLSSSEHWGRWTDGPNLKLVFDRALPYDFILTLVARPFGPNINRDIPLTVGSFTAQLKFSTTDAAEHVIRVRNRDRADTIGLTIPEPTAPSMLGNSTDRRLLGIGISSLKIKDHRLPARVIRAIVKSW